MQTTLGAILAILFIFTACTKEHFTDKNDFSQADAFKKAEIKYLQGYKSAILGEWKIDSIHMKLGYIEVPNSKDKDTIIYNYGKIVITSLNPDQIDSAKLNNLQGYIVTSNNDTIPIQSHLLAIPGKTKIDSINSVFGAIESDYIKEAVVPTNSLPISYQFLSNYMLGDNFQMYLNEDKTKFIWKGFRSIVQINLTKTR